jgi:hypothetical protein
VNGLNRELDGQSSRSGPLLYLQHSCKSMLFYPCPKARCESLRVRYLKRCPIGALKPSLRPGTAQLTSRKPPGGGRAVWSRQAQRPIPGAHPRASVQHHADA